MASIEELRKERIKKRDILLSAGKEVYPAETRRTHTLKTIQENFSNLSAEDITPWLAGRIMAIREHGSVVFIDLFDGSATFQVVLKEDEVGSEENFALFVEAVDIGDFIEVQGVLTTTDSGQNSLVVSDWSMLAKAIRPIPTQWHGLEDTEKRLRQRHIDILMNEEVRELIRRRSVFWQTIRSFLEDRGFMEVQTPVLEKTPGGADANPFVTHYDAHDTDVYLRISAGELWQKRLMIAGFEKTFEIGRIFRNEGISREHLQDYVQMEFYWAYADQEDGMELVTELFRKIADKVFSTYKFSVRGHEVDLSADWNRIDFTETIAEETGLIIADCELSDLCQYLDNQNVDYDSNTITYPRALDLIWKQCRKEISGPAFLVGIPTSLSPLAKTSSETKNRALRFQPIIFGTELGNGYSELNDPTLQKKYFKEQQKLREAGDKEAQRHDSEYVKALEYGMPPTCGFGMSERVFSVFADVSIREAQIFPFMK